MNDNEIEQLIIERSKVLASIAEKEAYRNMLKKQVQDRIDALIPQELKDELASIDAEFPTEAETNLAEEMKNQLTAAVLNAAHTVKVDGVGQVIYNKGRVTWETKGLEGLIKAVPVLAEFKKVGDPYITFR